MQSWTNYNAGNGGSPTFYLYVCDPLDNSET